MIWFCNFCHEISNIQFLFVEDDSDGFTYDEAEAKCQSIGGNILEPYNEIAITDSTHVLTDILGQTDKKFWIGIQFDENDFRKRLPHSYIPSINTPCIQNATISQSTVSSLEKRRVCIRASSDVKKSAFRAKKGRVQ